MAPDRAPRAEVVDEGVKLQVELRERSCARLLIEEDRLELLQRLLNRRRGAPNSPCAELSDQ